jgi:hypothetical protein
LWSLVNGIWQYTDYAYTAYTGSPATMSSPANGATLGSSTVTFQWTAGTATLYGLWVGSTGVGSCDLVQTGGTGALSYMATGLPIDGRTLNVRLWSLVNGAWQSHDYTYTAWSGSPATMTIPADGTVLSSSTVTFQWTAGTATLHGLWIGSTGVGSCDLVQTGGTSALSYMATGLPIDGRTLNVRLWSLVNGAWQTHDYAFEAFTATPGTMTSPSNGSTLSSSTVTFQWTAGTATLYGLWIGSTGVGSCDLVQTGGTGALSYMATGLPIDGRTLNVRLWSLVNGAWQSHDYTYTAL